RGLGRDAVLDGLARQALLALSSDWAFMVSKGSAADYARARAARHAGHVVEITELLRAGEREKAARVVADYDARDGVFGQLDAWQLRRPDDRTACCMPTGR
ncbi:MAG: DUF1957 domain-containing protein, partial [Pseudonocardia sp.]|nr:DUF1957 domain-containing protein [Pseudonocardia sp.]